MQHRYVDIVDPDQLELRTGPMPAPGPGEVLIAVDYAGVNRADVLQRLGLYPVPEDASPVMGLEVAGTVVDRGEGVTTLQPDTPVCALVHGGGYASHAVARADHCLPIPDSLDFKAAAALPEALLTVWQNVFRLGRLRPGETVLFHGGTSGIGSIGIQMATSMGATAVATAGGNEKCELARQLGAEFVADYKAGALRELFAVPGLVGKIDVILDVAGGDFCQQNLELAAPDGRIVCIGVMRGSGAHIELFSILAKRLTLTGSTLRGMAAQERAAGFEAIARDFMPAVAEGRIRPIIHTVAALEDAMEAHQLMQSGSHSGKILLDCRGV